MLKFFKALFTKNFGLKAMALILALVSWFYIVKELNKGTEDEMRFLRKILPSEGLTARRLAIKPVFVGKMRRGYRIVSDKIVIVPDYCIVVGTKELLEKIRFAYTMPVDLTGTFRTFTKSAALSPIAPGIYMEETLVQITVPIERAGSS